MQHRNNESNAWLITHIKSLVDVQKDGTELWERKCKGSGNAAVLYSHVIADKNDADVWQQYLTKKGIKCSVEPSGGADNAFRIVIPVAGQQMKKTRFNTTHTDVSDKESMQKILNMLNDATPAALERWEVSANHAGQRLITCVSQQVSLKNDELHLTALINNILHKGAFSEDSRRSIRHYFLDNLYVEVHENYNMYTIIDLAYMEQIEMVARGGSS